MLNGIAVAVPGCLGSRGVLLHGTGAVQRQGAGGLVKVPAIGRSQRPACRDGGIAGEVTGGKSGDPLAGFSVPAKEHHAVRSGFRQTAISLAAVNGLFRRVGQIQNAVCGVKDQGNGLEHGSISRDLYLNGFTGQMGGSFSVAHQIGAGGKAGHGIAGAGSVGGAALCGPLHGGGGAGNGAVCSIGGAGCSGFQPGRCPLRRLCNADLEGNGLAAVGNGDSLGAGAGQLGNIAGETAGNGLYRVIVIGGFQGQTGGVQGITHRVTGPGGLGGNGKGGDLLLLHGDRAVGGKAVHGFCGDNGGAIANCLDGAVRGDRSDMGIIGTPCDGLIGGVAGHHVGSKLDCAIQAIQGGIFRCGLDAGGLDGVHRHFTAGGFAIVALGGDGSCTKTDRLDHAIGNGGNGGVAGTPGKGLVGGVAGRDRSSQGLGRAGAGKAQAVFI